MLHSSLDRDLQWAEQDETLIRIPQVIVPGQPPPSFAWDLFWGTTSDGVEMASQPFLVPHPNCVGRRYGNRVHQLSL